MAASADQTATLSEKESFRTISIEIAVTQTDKNQFGTFGGVFTPAILTILGVIMFMRANFVLGHAGIINAIIILSLAKFITLSTSFSISAVSTNMQMRGGGSYFLISRVLGAEIGGAIGIALFFALALSVPFYILGFTEALVRIYPQLAPHFLKITLAAAFILFVIAYYGAGFAIKTQYLIMLFLVLAIIAFLGGSLSLFSWERFVANLGPVPQTIGEDSNIVGFWTLFAIYFPAVTGIDAGVNMSGDLKDPGRSIPKGTFAAVIVGFLVYLLQLILSGGAFAREDLIVAPFETLRNNAIFDWGILVAFGVVAATLSSALSSYLGAARVLQAVSKDRMLSFLKPFAKGTAKGDEPRRALVLSLVITIMLLLWAGNASGGMALNAVAAVITMFFLYTYGMINLSAFIEDFSDNPSFRPRFRYFHWSIALFGGLGAVIVSFLVNWLSSIAAVLIISLFLWHLKSRRLKAAFGDARRGFIFNRVRTNLFRLNQFPDDPKNWRPAALVFSGKPSEREDLIMFASWFEAKRGLVYLANVLTGDFEDLSNYRKGALAQLNKFCRDNNFEAFPIVVMSPSLELGISMVLQATATGPIRPNFAVFGWPHKKERMSPYIKELRTASSLEMSLVLLESKLHPREIISRKKRIDVWWRGRKNGGLMMLLAYLLRENWEWDDADIRVLRMVEKEDGRKPATLALQGLIDQARVDATASTVMSNGDFMDTLETESADASCTILGFELPAESEEDSWHTKYSGFFAKIPTVVLVNSRGGEDLLA